MNLNPLNRPCSQSDTSIGFVKPLDIIQHEEQIKANKNAQKYQQESLQILRAIEQNTASLHVLVELISKNNDQQEELILIITEVLTIATAKTKKEAESKYRSVMEKITKSVKDIETMSKVVNCATTVWNIVQSFIYNLPS